MSLSIDPAVSASIKATSTFQELSKTANSINTASDELSRVIEKFDANLRKLNLGVNGWVDIRNWSSEDNHWGTDQIGYDKINGKWGIAISSSEGCADWAEFDKSTVWLFNDAPRELRIRAVEHIPKLIEQLNKLGNKLAAELLEKTREADQLATALGALVESPKPAKGFVVKGVAKV